MTQQKTMKNFVPLCPRNTLSATNSDYTVTGFCEWFSKLFILRQMIMPKEKYNISWALNYNNVE